MDKAGWIEALDKAETPRNEMEARQRFADATQQMMTIYNKAALDKQKYGVILPESYDDFSALQSELKGSLHLLGGEYDPARREQEMYIDGNQTGLVAIRNARQEEIEEALALLRETQREQYLRQQEEIEANRKKPPIIDDGEAVFETPRVRGIAEKGEAVKRVPRKPRKKKAAAKKMTDKKLARKKSAKKKPAAKKRSYKKTTKRKTAKKRTVKRKEKK